MQCNFYSAIAEIPATTWNDLFDSENPFVQHAFLLALEASGCVSPATGWHAQHMVLTDAGRPMAVLPLYAKNHSYGEFVFDWGWAEAYQRHGLDYYPKLLTAIPFSPVAGPRVGVRPGADTGVVFEALLSALHQLAASHEYSSWHLLFPGQRLQSALLNMREEGAFLRREAVQFHWFNHGYATFDDFLATLRSSRRKNLKRERRMVAEQGVTVERTPGAQISDAEWEGFYQCYMSTYRKRSGHAGYLNRVFFDQLRAAMPEKLMLVVARREGEIVASSLFLHDSKQLYGRYWGALQDVSCLHFEACFYQGIEFCIERGLQKFDPGTQGEHKLMRGFEPVKSASYHWIADHRFRAAIADFLSHEKRSTDRYQEQAAVFLPYKRSAD
ncbi:MAG: GNAT family N-acetyltransferase [Gammaproteobacteria bacterium]|nr:GNAT family N-acetyltransferase [Gammaproteobacteria bacterium]NNK99508.1 N-acetyltransferase [Xanthomonadales bacterium]